MYKYEIYVHRPVSQYACIFGNMDLNLLSLAQKMQVTLLQQYYLLIHLILVSLSCAITCSVLFHL
jgi:hypothetical protein